MAKQKTSKSTRTSSEHQSADKKRKVVAPAEVAVKTVLPVAPAESNRHEVSKIEQVEIPVPAPMHIPAAVHTSTTEQIVKFMVAGQLSGLPVDQVVEAIRMVAFTMIPGTHPGLLGVLNFRGRVIPLINLHTVLGLPQNHINLNTPILVARNGSQIIALVVDEVLDVDSFPLSTRTPPGSLSIDARFVAAIAQASGKLLLVLDLENIHREIPSADLAAAQSSRQPVMA